MDSQFYQNRRKAKLRSPNPNTAALELNDINQQSAQLRSASQPRSLPQSGNWGPTVSRLLHLGLPLSTGSPNASLDHELSDGLVGNGDAMTLEKLPGRQCRAKIRIPARCKRARDLQTRDARNHRSGRIRRGMRAAVEVAGLWADDPCAGSTGPWRSAADARSPWPSRSRGF
jgi:hypothetical protein